MSQDNLAEVIDMHPVIVETPPSEIAVYSKPENLRDRLAKLEKDVYSLQLIIQYDRANFTANLLYFKEQLNEQTQKYFKYVDSKFGDKESNYRELSDHTCQLLETLNKKCEEATELNVDSFSRKDRKKV